MRVYVSEREWGRIREFTVFGAEHSRKCHDKRVKNVAGNIMRLKYSANFCRNENNNFRFYDFDKWKSASARESERERGDKYTHINRISYTTRWTLLLLFRAETLRSTMKCMYNTTQTDSFILTRCGCVLNFGSLVCVCAPRRICTYKYIHTDPTHRHTRTLHLSGNVKIGWRNYVKNAAENE